jgi:hypothetical protein
MNVTCPSCGAEMDLDVLLAHEESRQALATLAAISLPLGKVVLQYVRLFKPAKRAMGISRTVKLITELLPDLQRQAIERKGREWDAPIEAWRIAIEHVFAMRDKGALTLPLTSHGYLYEVLAGMADKVEAQAERDAEAQRRHRRGPEAAPQPAAAALASAPAPANYSTPSPYALKLQAEIAAKRRAAAAPAEGDGA